MEPIYVDPNDSSTARVVRAAFPGYKGRKVRIAPLRLPMRVSSYWDGGSRDYFAVVELATGKTLSVASNHPVFERSNPDTIDALPDGYAVVEHTFFCGKDHGITIHAHVSNLAPLLPAPATLTEDESTVLVYTRTYKNTYAGETNVRFREARSKNGITTERWEAAKAACIARGFLNRAGAITDNGRNAVAGASRQ